MTTEDTSPQRMETEEEEAKKRNETEGERRRPGIATKKKMIISSLICGGLFVLLWGLLGFPNKGAKARAADNRTCTVDDSICRQGWKSINRNCFFQSEQETTWFKSLENCVTYKASLAILNSKNEMDSLMNYLGPSSYWLGLSKHNVSTVWTWANGNPFTNWFNIEGGGNCAFLFKNEIKSSDCNDARKYVCSHKLLCP